MCKQINTGIRGKAGLTVNGTQHVELGRCTYVSESHIQYGFSSSCESTRQVLGSANDVIWKGYRVNWDRITGNETVRRTTLSLAALHSTPVIYAMRQVQDNHYQCRVNHYQSESYFQNGRGKAFILCAFVKILRRIRGQPPSALEQLYSKVEKSTGEKPSKWT